MDDRCDEKVVSDAQKGNKQAYALLVRRYYRSVFAVCLGLLGNVDDAEDIAQDTMLKGFLRMKNLRRNDYFGQWILRIASNLCVDMVRRRRHVKAILAEYALGSACGGSSSEEIYRLQRGIRRLPQELRVPLVMYYFEDRGTEKIAKRLNISNSGVYQRIRAARKQLHNLLSEEVDNEQ